MVFKRFSFERPAGGFTANYGIDPIPIPSKYGAVLPAPILIPIFLFFNLFKTWNVNVSVLKQFTGLHAQQSCSDPVESQG